jgi:hypothetical protein
VDARPNGEQETYREERQANGGTQSSALRQVTVERAEPSRDECDRDDEHLDPNFPTPANTTPLH